MGIATEKQISYIAALMAERAVPDRILDVMKRDASRPDFSTRDASSHINMLRMYPRKRQATTSAPTGWAAANAELAELDTSFYAIPAGYVSAQGEIDLHGNDYLFVRIRNYQGRRYVSRVHGSYASLRYSRFQSPRTVIAIARLIADNAHEFQRNWFNLSGNCGRCNSPLTDRVSREYGFGPECRKVMGMK